MLKNNTQGGRPRNLTVKGELVRRLRRELGLTQAALVQRVYSELEIRHVPDVDGLEKQCRRWESENAINRKALKALARVLGTTETHLCEGGAPGPARDRIAEITQQLHHQLTAGSQVTHKFVEEVRELEELEAIPALADHEAAIQMAARAIETRLGSAQLTCRLDKLSELGAITGWSLTELLKPAGSQSYWLVATEGAAKTSSEIHRGTYAALMCVWREVKEWRQNRSWDSRAILREDAPWFRVHLEDPRFELLNTTISLVRFEPGETGLRWSQATERERWDVLDGMASHLARDFAFVRDFTDNLDWPDFRRMRLEMWDESNSAAGLPPIRVGRFKGALDRLIDSALPSFARDATAHYAVNNWLAADLDEELAQHLSKWPRGCWKAEAAQGAIYILLDTPWGVAQQLGRAPVLLQKQFSLFLVEEREDGSSRRLPWSDEAVALVADRVTRTLDGLPDFVARDTVLAGTPSPTGG